MGNRPSSIALLDAEAAAKQVYQDQIFAATGDIGRLADCTLEANGKIKFLLSQLTNPSPSYTPVQISSEIRARLQSSLEKLKDYNDRYRALLSGEVEDRGDIKLDDYASFKKDTYNFCQKSLRLVDAEILAMYKKITMAGALDEEQKRELETTLTQCGIPDIHY